MAWMLRDTQIARVRMMSGSIVTPAAGLRFGSSSVRSGHLMDVGVWREAVVSR